LPLSLSNSFLVQFFPCPNLSRFTPWLLFWFCRCRIYRRMENGANGALVDDVQFIIERRTAPYRRTVERRMGCQCTIYRRTENGLPMYDLS
jgi:hypothetical protein